MKLLSALFVGLLVTGCSGQGQRPSPASTIPDDGKWFCQMEESGESWECVRDPQLAENPKPTRLPQPAPQVTSKPPPRATSEPPARVIPEPPLPPDDEPLPLGEPTPSQARSTEEPPPERPPADSPSPPPLGPLPVPEATAPAPEGADDDALPEYARLAYHPPQPVPLADLPKDFYAVQLVAMSTKQELEAFAAREQVHGMSAARVESDGKVYFVLLLGIYESLENAERAVAAMPEVSGVEPWIRPLGSLQSAMLRADRMTGAAHY